MHTSALLHLQIVSAKHSGARPRGHRPPGPSPVQALQEQAPLAQLAWWRSLRLHGLTSYREASFPTCIPRRWICPGLFSQERRVCTDPRQHNSIRDHCLVSESCPFISNYLRKADSWPQALKQSCEAVTLASVGLHSVEVGMSPPSTSWPWLSTAPAGVTQSQDLGHKCQ